MGTSCIPVCIVMDNLPIILELRQVVDPFLDDGSLYNYEVEKLGQAGDNYGSILLSICSQVKRPNAEIVIKRLVAKVPPADRKSWEFIQPERTCLAENAIYKNLAPALSALQNEFGVAREAQFDGFAQYFGSRISLKPGQEVVDKDAILVLEDLRAKNYMPGDRLQPLDLPHTELTLKYMAHFHALTISLKLKKPTVFAKQIRPFFDKFDWHAAAPESKAVMIRETIEDIRKATNNDKGMVLQIEKLLHELFSFLAAPPEENNPFNSVIHSDFWTMNLMFKYDSSMNPTHLKIIDFQTAQYDSIIHDIIAFLFTSSSTTILEENFTFLLRVYHDAFIKCLNEFDVNTEAYSYKAFYCELKRVAYIQVPHAIFMTRFILADNVSKEHKHDISTALSSNSSKRVQDKLGDIIRLALKFKIL